MSMTFQPMGAIEGSIEQKTNDAYHRARSRERAPHKLLDHEYMRLKNELAVINTGDGFGRPRATADADRAKALNAALAVFQRWADMPDRELPGAAYAIYHPPAPPTPPDRIAQDRITEMRNRGIVLTSDAQGGLMARPAEKLTAADKQTLESFKAYFVAEVNREVYIVP